ncbi:MAG TPA: hypothetical protein VG992_03490 [Candidatus Saccharimonadales bacterium]|nr:hypothetical protein [Candidatus Saccharimonadales bacterium]
MIGEQYPRPEHRAMAEDFFGDSNEAIQVAMDDGDVHESFSEFCRILGLLDPTVVSQLEAEAKAAVLSAYDAQLMDRIAELVD